MMMFLLILFGICETGGAIALFVIIHRRPNTLVKRYRKGLSILTVVDLAFGCSSFMLLATGVDSPGPVTWGVFLLLATLNVFVATIV